MNIDYPQGWCESDLNPDSVTRLIDNRRLEQAIIKAAENDDDTLDSLLQEAIETMDEAQANHLLNKVHQILKEGLCDARGWKDDRD